MAAGRLELRFRQAAAAPAGDRRLAALLGLSEAETADVLGISVGAVKSQLHAARRRLAQSLSEAGLAPTTRAAASTKGTT
jgi:hypothetical protein